MPTARVERLEERMAWLERHVTEQDKAMLELNGQLDRLRQEVTRLRARAAAGGEGPALPATDERPPHY